MADAHAQRIKRLVLVRYSPPDEPIRRYRLARLDEVALACPPRAARAQLPHDRRDGEIEKAGEPNRELPAG